MVIRLDTYQLMFRLVAAELGSNIVSVWMVVVVLSRLGILACDCACELVVVSAL